MKLLRLSLVGCLAAALVPAALAADDTVTLPKSRLEELQRKEAELDKLKSDLLRTKNDLDKTKEDLDKTKGALDKTKGENLQLQQQHATDSATLAHPAVAAPAYQSPPLASLPPLDKSTPVNSMDLANYYKMDRSTADQRFLKRSFAVQGRVVDISKPYFIRPYKLVLKTPDGGLRVLCNVQPPEKYKTVLSVKNDSELIGTSEREEDQLILKVDDMVVVHGECKGLDGNTVVMGACELKSVNRKR